VSVTKSGVEQTYISYSGDTIITIEKGVTKTLTATLAGLNAATQDSKALQWKQGKYIRINNSDVRPNVA
jgi:hypothetical protein